MKVFWIIASANEACRLGMEAVIGDTLFGDVLWARGLDAATAGMFLLAAIAAFRIRAAWTF